MRPGRGSHYRKNSISTSLKVGKYRISPLLKTLADGRIVTSVSVRSGAGSGSHDRVIRLSPLFNSTRDAVQYATGQGLAWVHNHAMAGPSQA